MWGGAAAVVGAAAAAAAVPAGQRVRQADAQVHLGRPHQRAGGGVVARAGEVGNALVRAAVPPATRVVPLQAIPQPRLARHAAVVAHRGGGRAHARAGATAATTCAGTHPRRRRRCGGGGGGGGGLGLVKIMIVIVQRRRLRIRRWHGRVLAPVRPGRRAAAGATRAHDTATHRVA